MELLQAENLNRQQTKMFRLFDNDTELGFFQIRMKAGCSANFPRECASHIYYEIHREHRGKGYGNTLLSLSISKAKKLGISGISISCSPDNAASRKIIEKYASYRGEYAGLNGETLLMYDVV